MREVRPYHESITDPIRGIMTKNASRERSLGVIGGLSPLADADMLAKLIEATESHPDAGRFEIVFEQRPFLRTPAARMAQPPRACSTSTTASTASASGASASWCCRVSSATRSSKS